MFFGVISAYYSYYNFGKLIFWLENTCIHSYLIQQKCPQNQFVILSVVYHIDSVGCLFFSLSLTNWNECTVMKT